MEIVSDYLLTLDPRIPTAVALPDGASLALGVYQGGDHEVYDLGPGDGAGWELPEMGPLVDAQIAFELVQGSDVPMWGLTPPITLTSGPETVPVFVGPVGKLTTWSAFELIDVSLGGAAAVLPDGDIIVFGGSEAVIGSSGLGAQSHILKMSRTQGDLAFEEIGTMPADLPPSKAARVGGTATVLPSPDGPEVLIIGGRPSWMPPTQSYQQAFAWNPETRETTWNLSMFRPRSQHQTLPWSEGRYLVLGGFDDLGVSDALDYEVFSPEERVFTAGQTLAGTGDVGFAAADLGEWGILVCGGAANPGTALFEARSACHRIRPDAAGSEGVDLVTALPGPNGTALGRSFHQLTALPDGRALLTGGTTNGIPLTGATPASDETWIYTPNATGGTWSAGPSLVTPRAMHAALLRPDGTVLLTGGLQEAIGPSTLPNTLVSPTECDEIFDPQTETLTTVTPCDSLGGGLPLIASAPGYGTFVSEGFTTEGGGRQWGMIADGLAPVGLDE